MENLNRYVKVKGHDNWFLVLEKGQLEPENLSEKMQEQILRSEVCKLHDPSKTMDFVHRVTLAATREIDYEKLAEKYGTILIRPIGSFMPLYYNEIIEECFDFHFPITDFAEIVICENDKTAEWQWVEYLEKRFPKQKISTINFFDLRSEHEVKLYFEKAKYITFSTTFTRYEWFEKLVRNSNASHKIIGYCHDADKWKRAIEICNNIEIVKKWK